MEIRICKTTTSNEKIEKPDDWTEPMSEKHLQEGRSAKLLERFALSESFGDAINKILNDYGLSTNGSFKCIPECKSSLGKGMGRGGSRNHDALLIGDDCVVGIEAKVSEPFDKCIREKSKLQGEDKNGMTRADKLSQFLCGDNDVSNIGYQLFAATYGTMKAAIDEGRENCVMLVVVFNGNVKKERNYCVKIKKNEDDFNNFKQSLQDIENDCITREIDGKRIKCWIKKVIVTVQDNSFVVIWP